MDNKSSHIISHELICTVVDLGSGSEVIKIAKENQISGGTIFLGNGTINNRLLEFLSLTQVRKEIVIMIAEKTTAHKALTILNKKFEFKKSDHGIAFTIPLTNFLGARNCIDKNNPEKESRGVKNPMYKAVFTIVDKGKGESVMDAAKKAGTKGGTIINARGSGIHETEMLFSMPVEPEKEVVMILAKNNLVNAIISSIREDLKIDEPGKGIMFTLEVNKTYGLN
ncbi:MAG TPA: P-II family nitrogen regulator [Halanaerobiales bacterium]|nr:P-II family nitrogen regulator [Halanaerobiales bacterium]